MKVVITGAAGQLGTDLRRECEQAGDDVIAPSRAEFDITNERHRTHFITAGRPDLIINCAAWTAVDACESDPERAMEINGRAVGGLAFAANEVGAHLVHVSTDYVFSGTKRGAYGEDDAPDPASAYGRSKLLGEQSAGSDATIVRTSWVFSAHGGNMVATICRLLAGHDPIRFVDDQRGRPTFTRELARALRNLGRDRIRGVIHVANHGEVSWYEFARAVARAAGHDPDRIEPVSTADLDPPRPAPRPANSVLSTVKYEALGYTPLPHFERSLEAVIPHYRASQ